ncbi:MAG TPA: SRPBCC family protein [Anaerolineales bacterium]|nr:SRPBCC family protein [Anaerolineales bacterium]
MKFKLQLPINKSRAEVWKAFDNVENMKKWQPSLVSFELVSGTPGQPGAVSKLTYEEKGREFALIEKITHRDEPHRFDGVYENNFADNVVRNTFVEQGKDQTLWIVETEYKFKTMLMKILGSLMKKNFVVRTQRDMERFKEMVESQ